MSTVLNEDAKFLSTIHHLWMLTKSFDEKKFGAFHLKLEHVLLEFESAQKNFDVHVHNMYIVYDS